MELIPINVYPVEMAMISRKIYTEYFRGPVSFPRQKLRGGLEYAAHRYAVKNVITSIEGS